ncbi:piggyBac transposable element-derived protein 4-like [Rhopalosiphum maidis]|uniref:piggyBac transposable element-derived protein 4-like n=1 Tax=Rhopalosiphum maidis TaxID=43146 RepID=UPI000EFE8329|nr:piggyBac transposable element-derived protein 4-like [Rhopalosiphum maidis]
MYKGKNTSLTVIEPNLEVLRYQIYCLKKTHSMGTLRSNHKRNSKEVTAKKLKRGKYVWRRNKNVYVSKWKDKRDGLCITTKNHPKIVSTTNRYGLVKNKPIEMKDYNDFISGIDHSDQMVSYYLCPSKTTRWYKKVLFHLLNISTWNSYFIFNKKFGVRNITFKRFRDLLIKNLIGLPIKTTAAELFKDKKSKNAAPENNHYSKKIPRPPNFKRETYFKNCKQCCKTKIRKQISFQCKSCGKPLCPGKCFEEWHKII